MKLAEHGYRVIGGRFPIFCRRRTGATSSSAGGWSARRPNSENLGQDAAALPAYYDALENVADVLRDLALKAPANVGGGVKALIDAARQGRRLAGLMPIGQQRDMLDLFVKSCPRFPRRLVRERGGEGRLRVRCGGRQLCQPRYAGIGLCSCSIMCSVR